MINRFCVILFLIQFSFIAYTQERTVNTWYDVAHTQLKESYTIVRVGNDTLVKHGKYTIYYSDKKLWQEGSYKHNELNGLWKDYYESGTLKQEMPYAEGKLNGILNYYYPSGNVQQKLSYKNDLLNAESFTYFENGKLQERVQRNRA